jgi:hypothetical protein
MRRCASLRTLCRSERLRNADPKLALEPGLNGTRSVSFKVRGLLPEFTLGINLLS